MPELMKLTFDASHERTTPAKARAAIQRLLGDDAPIAMIRDAVLLTSELVTNAVLHAPGGCMLEAQFTHEPLWLRVDVSDSSMEPPRPRQAAGDRLGGHGLHMIGTIADRWGWASVDNGKVIWFELTCTDRAL